MNPVFMFLVVLGVVILWFLLSFVFPVLGSFVLKIWKDTKYNINKSEKEDKE